MGLHEEHRMRLPTWHHCVSMLRVALASTTDCMGIEHAWYLASAYKRMSVCVALHVFHRHMQDSLEPQDSMTSASPSRLAAMTSRSASRTGSLVPTPPTGRPPSTQDASSPFSRAFTLLAQASEKPTAASPRASRTVSYCGAANPLDMRSTPDGVFASGPERFVSPSRPASRAMSRVQVDTPSRVPSQSYSGVPQGDAETLGEDGFRASVRPGRVGRGSDCGKVLVPTKSKGSLLALFDDEVPFPGAAGEEGLGKLAVFMHAWEFDSQQGTIKVLA